MLCKHGQADVLAPADDCRRKRHLDIQWCRAARFIASPGCSTYYIYTLCYAIIYGKVG
jgi:hypothetical protein